MEFIVQLLFLFMITVKFKKVGIPTFKSQKAAK